MTNDNIYPTKINTNPVKLYDEYLEDPSIPISIPTSTPDEKKYIYKITNTINGKVYIGQSKYPEERFKQHKCCFGKTRLYTSMKSYGVENFTMEVLFCTTEEFIDYYEVRFIDEFNSYCYLEGSNGYNMTRGGSRIDSGTLSIISKLRTEMGLNPFSKGNNGHEIAAENQRLLVREGKHIFQQIEHRKSVSKSQKERIENGTHHWKSKEHSENSSLRNKQKFEQGTHHLQSKEVKEKNKLISKQQLETGTHNYTMPMTCDVCGKTGKGKVMKRWHFENCGKKRETYNDGVKNYTVYDGECIDPSWKRGMAPKKKQQK